MRIVMKKFTSGSLFIVILVLIQACNIQADTSKDVSGDKNILKGYYIYGHEVNSFQPCKQKKVYWVNGSNEILAELEQQYSQHVTKPYDEVFVEITGKFTGKATDGFAMDYDGQITVLKLIKMSKKTNDSCN